MYINPGSAARYYLQGLKIYNGATKGTAVHGGGLYLSTSGPQCQIISCLFTLNSAVQKVSNIRPLRLMQRKRSAKPWPLVAGAGGEQHKTCTSFVLDALTHTRELRKTCLLLVFGLF